MPVRGKCHSNPSMVVGMDSFCAAPPTSSHHGSSSTSTSLPLQSCSLRMRPGNLSLGAGMSCMSRRAHAIQRLVLPRAKSEDVQSVAVEDEGVAVEGVIKVDKEQAARPSWRRAIILAGGDLLALLMFASVGRISHGMPAFTWEVVKTADPFVAGWLFGTYFLGGFGPEGQGLYGLRAASVSALKSWAVGVPLGLAIRSFTTGHTPAQTFIFISLGSTLVLLVGWRTGFTALFPNEDKSSSKVGDDRKGSVFEFMELLTSLVRRW